MLNPNPSPHCDPELLTRFQEELARAAALPCLATAGAALWLRFAGYYQGFTRMPRKARRTLQRRWRRSLGALALLCALGQAPALAATINVGGACTLVDAITAANNDAPTGGCTAGSGADTLVLPPGSTNTLTAVNNSFYGPTGLPLVTSGITIAGNGSTITRVPSAPQFGILGVLRGNLTLEETTVRGGVMTSSSSGGGVFNYEGTLTLTNSTVSGNSAARAGGGIANFGVLTLTSSTVSGNTAYYSGGVSNSFGSIATLTKSTVSGNSAILGGGLLAGSYSTITLTNSTVSGNSAAGAGGGVYSIGTVTLTNSTVSGNSAGGRGGGLDVAVFNRISSTLTLVQTVVSGNMASALGPEVYAAGTVVANNLNLFGHDGLAGVVGFAQGPTDNVPSGPLAAILNPTLGDNGGLTRTHALVAGSPAVDAVPAGNCVTTTDQRGAPRPQDGDGSTVADCDIGAFELGTQPPQAVPPAQNPQARCTASHCNIPIKCNLDPASGAQCAIRTDIFVSQSAARLSEPASTKVSGRIRFAAGVTNIPPGETANVRLKPTKQGKKIVRTSPRRSLRGVLEIRNTPGDLLSSTRIRIRLR